MRLFARAALCAAFVLGAATNAAAQTIDEEEIIVTARKREEDALRVPTVVTVLSEQELSARNVTDLHGVAALTPGIILGAGPLEVGTEVSLRGVGSSPLDPAIDQSVALNLDGLPLGQGSAYSVGVFDMSRIEVLHGPQPLFFGKNSPGGVIAIRTADPGDVSEILATFGYEPEARTTQTQLILSGPVTDTLGLRLSSQFTSSEGYFYNRAQAVLGTGAAQPSSRIGDRESLYLRLTALYEPSATFAARLKLNSTHDRVLGGAQEQLSYCPDGVTNYLPSIGLNFPSQFSANEDCQVDRTINIIDLDPNFFVGLSNNGVNFTDTTQRFGTLEANWEFRPGLTLTSVTGFYRLNVDAMQNGPWVGGAAPPIAIVKAFEREEFTQELRLTSDFDRTLDFTLGAFFQDARIFSDMSFLGNSFYGFPPAVLQGSHTVDIQSLALFGQVRWRPRSNIEIAAGVRWSDEERSDAPVTDDIFGAFTGTPGTQVAIDVPRLRTSNWSPELTVSWFPTDDLTIYGAFRRGYKSGSYNINQPLSPGDDNSFGDEEGQGAEVGVRGYAWNRQFYFDATAYSYEYSGLQVGTVRLSASNLPSLATMNAAESEVRGIDLALRYRPEAIPGLSMSGAINWNRGRFTEFLNAPCFPGQTIAEGCSLQPSPVTDAGEIAAGYYTLDPVSSTPVRYNAQDLSGTPLHRAPDWQARFSVDYERPLGPNLMLGAGADFRYSSSYLVDLGRRGDEGFQDAYVKFDANLRLGAADGRWELALIGANLGDELTTGGCFDINYPGGGGVFPGMITGAPIRGPAGSGEILCGYERGREVWLRLRVRPYAREH